MSLGATAKITAPANTWTPLSSGQTSVYFEMLGKGQAKFCVLLRPAASDECAGQ